MIIFKKNTIKEVFRTNALSVSPGSDLLNVYKLFSHDFSAETI